MNVGTKGTVARIIDLQRALASAGGGLGIKDLSDRVGLPPSTVHRLTQLLVEEGIAEKLPGERRYRAGVEFYRLGALVVSQRGVTDVADPFQRRVVEQCGEVCFLCLYLPSRRQVMIAHVVNARHSLRYALEPYQPLSAAWGATGRAVLAYLPEDEVVAILDEDEPSPATGERLPPRERMLAILADIRERGYAATVGQKMPGAVGIAAPVFGSHGRVIGSLCVTVPEFRNDPSMEAVIGELVRREAANLSEALGCAAPPRRAGLGA